MGRRIVVIQGHPDAQTRHFGHALADAYGEGARAGGHAVARIEVAALDFPLLRSKEAFEAGVPPPAIASAQETIRAAEHLVLLYPLWLGAMPALLKGFLEQVFRPGFAFVPGGAGRPGRPGLAGKSARLVVTMGMPAFVYRWYFGAHSLKSLERNILGFCGVKPIAETLIGGVEGLGERGRAKWLRRLHDLGRAGW